MDLTQSPLGQQVFAPRKSKPSMLVGVVRWLSWLRSEHPDLSLRARMALLVLAELEGGKRGQAYPSLRYLAEQLDCAPGAARAALRELEDAALIDREARFDTASFAGGRQTSNRYRVLAAPEDGRIYPVSTSRTAGAGSPTGTESTNSTNSSDSTEGTGPLPCEPPTPSLPQQGSEKEQEHQEESSSSAAEVPSVLFESLQKRFSPAECGQLLHVIQQVRPTTALLEHGVGRLLGAPRVENAPGYLRHVLRAELAAGNLQPPARAPDPWKTLTARIEQLNARMQAALSDGAGSDVHRALEIERDKLVAERFALRKRDLIGQAQRGAA